MKFSKKTIISTVLASIVTSTALAKDLDYAVGLTAGTMGVGVTSTVGITDNINARANLTGFKFKKDFDNTGDNSYSADLKLFGVGALVDYHPFSGDFRISGGLYYNGNKFDLKTSGDVDAGDNTYHNASIDAEVKYKKLAPYIGIGYGNAVDKNGRFKYSFDIGAMYTGKPDVSISGSNNIASSDLQKEKNKIEDDMIRWYPVISMSITYRF